MAAAFRAKGRAGRLRYLIYLMSYVPLVMLLGLFGPLYVLAIPIILINYPLVTIQRCHDLGLSGWWSLLLGLPGPNLALLGISGNAERNRFGEVPRIARTEWVAAPVAVLLTIVSCSAYYLYIFRPAFQAYETRLAIIGDAPWERSSGELAIQSFEFTKPTSGVITLDSGEGVPMLYRVRYRDLEVMFDLEGTRYAVQVRHDAHRNVLEAIEDGRVVGVYGQR
jgi:uncharacterized membrane protein YhaH (DUF805 family)